MLNSDISWFENSQDPDKLVSERPADQKRHCFLLLHYLFALILNIQVNNFSVKSGGSSWVEPVLSMIGLSVLLKDPTQCLRWGSNLQLCLNTRPLIWVVKHLNDQVKVIAMKQCVIVILSYFIRTWFQPYSYVHIYARLCVDWKLIFSPEQEAWN